MVCKDTKVAGRDGSQARRRLVGGYPAV